MIHKGPKPPLTQRRFGNAWAELDYLCKKIRYWLYTRKQSNLAARFLVRLQRVLQDLPENDIAIIRQEALALLHELRGDINESIAHRKREIELIERLHSEARSPKYSDGTKAYMLSERDDAGLKERRAILEALKKEKARRSTANSPRNGNLVQRESNGRHRRPARS